MSSARARAAAGALLGVAGGLGLAGGTSAAWVRTETVREIGGVAVTDVETTSGLALAGHGLALGLAGAAAGLALLVLRGRAQRVAGVLLAATGAVALLSVVAALARAPAGAPGGGAIAAAAGAVALALAGLSVLRPAPPPRLPARYDLDAPADDEWRLASGDEEPPPGEAPP